MTSGDVMNGNENAKYAMRLASHHMATTAVAIAAEATKIKGWSTSAAPGFLVDAARFPTDGFEAWIQRRIRRQSQPWTLPIFTKEGTVQPCRHY